MTRLRAAAALASDVVLRTLRGRTLVAFLVLSALLAGALVGGTSLVELPNGDTRWTSWVDEMAIDRPGPPEVAGPGILLGLLGGAILGKIASLFGVAAGVLVTGHAVASAFAPGRAELILPRPITRAEVVAARFAGALAFAALQVTWLTALLIVLTGLKFGVWLPWLLLAILPLLLKFSVLAAVTTLASVLLRSRTLGLVAAGAAWVLSWAVNGARENLHAIRADLTRLGETAQPAFGGAGPWIDWGQRLLPQVTHHDYLVHLACFPDVPVEAATFDPWVVAAQGVCWTVGPLLLTAWIVTRRDY